MGGSQVPMDLAVPNLTNQTLSVYWRDFQCVEQLVAVVEPNRAFYQSTYDGHEWIFRDASGQTVAEFTASTVNPLVMLGATVPYNPEPINTTCSDPNANVNVDLTTINNTLDPVMLFWIDYNCNEVLYEFIRGQDRAVITDAWVGHNWVVRHVDGRVAGQLTLSPTDHTIVIDPPATPGVAPTTAPAVNVAPTTAPAVNPASTTVPTVNGNSATITTTGPLPVTVSDCVVAPVTPDMGFEPFYTRYCDFNGLPIVGSADAPDEALQQAWLLAANVFYSRPDIASSLAGMGFQISVISEDQVITDVPELASLASDTQLNVNQYRGYDKVLEEPRVVAIGAENLLCSPDDAYFGESIFVNSLGNLTRFALQRDLEPTFGDRVEAARQNAINTGLWDGSWITESNGNYWNYGVKAYFNAVDMVNGLTDEFTNTRNELAAYDPQLFMLIHSVYNSTDWTPNCPSAEVAAQPTLEPTLAPTIAPTLTPTFEPTVVATIVPTSQSANAAGSEDFGEAAPAPAFPVMVSRCIVAPVTPDMGFDPFYTKYCDFNGLPIVASSDTPDTALQQAWVLAANVYYNRPDVVTSLVNQGFQISIIAENQVITDVPELAYLAEDATLNVNQYRGYDKVLEEPRVIAIGADNLLCSPNDAYFGENILVNSLGNLTRFALVMDLDPAFGDQVAAARQHAIDTGLWDASWITESNGNYWNYGVKSYFNSVDLVAGQTDEFTNTRTELASYDPQLFMLIHSVFNSEEWTPVCPPLS